MEQTQRVCNFCNKNFLIKTTLLKSELKRKGNRGSFCSATCAADNQKRSQQFNCTNCYKELWKKPCELRQSKSGNTFCGRSCAATYNNRHKTTGTRKSKLECWIESQLITLYPDLEIHFNRKDAIGSELDIYIPSHNLAFELNGIFHYEPIYGIDKFNQTIANDGIKKQICFERNINLVAINVSKQNRFSEKTSYQYLEMIIDYLN